MLINRFAPVFYYAGPADPTGGGGGAAAVVEPPAAQPGSGQGTQDASANGDFWGMFPDVPEEMREQLEPHLKNVQGHVTRVEQQLAQFKPILDSGFTPDQVQGLVKFSQDFDANPLETWLKIGQALQQPGAEGQQAVISDDLDLEILAAIATGQEIPDDPAAGTQQQQPQGQGLEGLPPQMAEMFQTMQSRLEAAEGALQQQQQQREADQTRAQQEAQQRLLAQQMGTMKETLTTAGYPAELLEDNPETGANGSQLMRSALIAANGNVQTAIKSLQDQRAAILKGFTQENAGQRKPLETKETPPGPKRTRQPRDSWDKGRQGAAAFLRRQAESAAQG